MPKREFKLDGVGLITTYKRRGTKSIKLRISADGDVRVTIPAWTPYKVGEQFALSKRSWILAQLPSAMSIVHDDLIGKRHKVVISYRHTKNQTIRTVVKDDRIQAWLPFGEDIRSAEAQKALKTGAIKALRVEAAEYLPRRVQALAETHGFDYANVSLKRLKSRWGSCTDKGNISLNIYLMQLDDDLIDYVILHELMHTRILEHGPKFWNALAEYVENLDKIRIRIRHAEPKLVLR